MTRPLAPNQVLWASCAVIALLVAADLSTHLAFFDLLEESNLPTWVSQADFLLAAAACTAAGLQDERARTAWLLLAGAMTFFSLDEVAMIHERIEDHGSIELALLGIEPLLGLALIVGVYAVLRTHVEKRVLVLLGAATLALVLAQTTSAIDGVAEPTGFVYDLFAILEEVFEMLTGSLVLVAALAQPANTK